MKKLLVVLAIISLMAAPAYAKCGCQKKAEPKPCGCKKHVDPCGCKKQSSESKGTQISAANQKAHAEAKTEKEAIKTEAKQ